MFENKFREKQPRLVCSQSLNLRKHRKGSAACLTRVIHHLLSFEKQKSGTFPLFSPLMSIMILMFIVPYYASYCKKAGIKIPFLQYCTNMHTHPRTHAHKHTHTHKCTDTHLHNQLVWISEVVQYSSLYNT